MAPNVRITHFQVIRANYTLSRVGISFTCKEHTIVDFRPEIFISTQYPLRVSYESDPDGEY